MHLEEFIRSQSSRKNVAHREMMENPHIVSAARAAALAMTITTRGEDLLLSFSLREPATSAAHSAPSE